ncbi:hypothetical protein PR048_001728 [Dryococelus australis]|uniref:Reverse transcriptase domain-containing protein n=1 Tax=Dryococelus australis TaxID=614101 RepID=A0ABQ9IIB9_9NEOP|nr:hypothetical protein PR048_001728 [Dryococelus australis]
MRLTRYELCLEETSPFSLEELNGIVRKTKLNKAPGVDGLTGKCSFDDIQGYGTKCWHLIYKGGGRNLRKSKSYRPITLFSVMGKRLECLVNGRLMEYLDIVQDIHPNQYGFMKCKCMEIAVIDMFNQVRSYDQTYVLVVSLYISGAFDNA